MYVTERLIQLKVLMGRETEVSLANTDVKAMLIGAINNHHIERARMLIMNVKIEKLHVFVYVYMHNASPVSPDAGQTEKWEPIEYGSFSYLSFDVFSLCC